jgi:tetratricopeptide (TPR) repeat protein
LTALQQAELAFPRRSRELEYVFKHATVQEVAYGMLVPKRRKQLHLRTARAIAVLYPWDDLVEVIAYHYGRAEAGAESIPWLERAGDRAATSYANDAAIAHYREARKVLERVGGDRLGLARLDEKLGGVLSTVGKYDEAISILERAIEIYRQEADLEGAGRATALLGRTHLREGTPEAGITLVEPMIDLLRASGPSSALASLQIALSHLFFLVGRYREMLAAAERGSEIARAVGNDRLLGEAETRRGTALDMLGREEEGAQVLEDALPLVEAGGDLDALSRTLNNLGSFAMELGRGEQMRQCYERALAVAERMGNPSDICFSLCNVGEGLLVLGEWQEARQILQRTLPLASPMGRGMGVAFLQATFGTLALWEGNWDEASRSLQESLAVAEETGDRAMRELAHAYLAELSVLRGGPEGAIRRLEPLVQEGHAHPELLPHLAWAYLCIDDGEHLQQAAAAAERAVSQRQKQPVFLVEALWVQGMVLIRQGRDEEATGVLTKGLALVRSMPYPYREACILEQMGILAQQRDDPEQAQARLEEALAIFRRLGAKKDVERTEQAQAALDRSTDPAS